MLISRALSIPDQPFGDASPSGQGTCGGINYPSHMAGVWRRPAWVLRGCLGRVVRDSSPCKLQRCTMQDMATTINARVSHRGQTSLPADLRHRWGIEAGGEIGFIDLGNAALVVPGGVDVARQELRRVLRDRYATGIAAIDDPDLADQ